MGGFQLLLQRQRVGGTGLTAELFIVSERPQSSFRGGEGTQRQAVWSLSGEPRREKGGEGRNVTTVGGTVAPSLETGRRASPLSHLDALEGCTGKEKMVYAHGGILLSQKE